MGLWCSGVHVRHLVLVGGGVVEYRFLLCYLRKDLKKPKVWFYFSKLDNTLYKYKILKFLKSIKVLNSSFISLNTICMQPFQQPTMFQA